MTAEQQARERSCGDILNRIPDDNEAAAIAAAVQHDYLSTRVLPDGSVACLGDLMFTRAIILGVSREGYGRRFCFEDRVLASKRFAELSSEDDVPDGYVAQR